MKTHTDARLIDIGKPKPARPVCGRCCGKRWRRTGDTSPATGNGKRQPPIKRGLRFSLSLSFMSCYGSIRGLPSGSTSFWGVFLFCLSLSVLHSPKQTNMTTQPNCSYSTYLQSEHWQRVRSKYKQRSRKTRKDKRITCKLCSSFKPIDVHHLTYARVGRELAGDVMGLCRSCHNLAHDVAKVTVDSAATLPKILKKARSAWFSKANSENLWHLRESNPGEFTRLAAEFLYVKVGKLQRYDRRGEFNTPPTQRR